MFDSRLERGGTWNEGPRLASIIWTVNSIELLLFLMENVVQLNIRLKEYCIIPNRKHV